MTAPFAPHAGARDPARLLDHTLAAWNGRGDVWVFGYASLIWRPEFEAVEERPATVHGWHRALAMRSRINRGTPERPGLVFALVPGGSCRGRAYRIERTHVESELGRLWAREMPSGVYDPRWLACRTPEGIVRGLAFTLSRRSPSHTGELPEGELLDIFRTANGRYGSTLAYLVETAHSLRSCGIHDRDVERLVALARRHALTA
ncbi:MAG TPA: gamma-glutamylcyclotransferase [Caldimonas sp.]|jgi:cation transport protein ChaC|nr:gamma-glutamylcyclotransferase [Caldimonas sp.]HEX4234749.1 gamma-glutamylcyclotransferase [Caldimonas sp.]